MVPLRFSMERTGARREGGGENGERDKGEEGSVERVKLSMRLIRLENANRLLLAHCHIPLAVLIEGSEDSAVDACFEVLEEEIGPELLTARNILQKTFSLEGSYTLANRVTGEEMHWTSSFSQTGSQLGQLKPFVTLVSRNQVAAAVTLAKRAEDIQFRLVESVHAERPDTQWQFDKLISIVGE